MFDAPMPVWQVAVMVLVMALATLLTRALPFMAFPLGRPTPRYIVYLGRVLPFAVTTMLLVYCLKDVQVFLPPHGLPELAGIVLVAVLFLLFKNSLLSIAAGTVVYMLLVQVVWA